ncbi:CBS domain-containing protein [Streptomyces violascens]|uniref:CBS domain-containing protein n=1 Tax=Streptomyces violascens TaxID=67381 RepID=UPI003655A71C
MNESPYFVSDVMSRPVVAVVREAPFKEIAEALARWRVNAMPVLDSARRVVGVVSEADLLLKEEFRGLASKGAGRVRRPVDLAKAGGSTAEDLMTSPAITVHEDMTLPQAARIMAVEKVKRLPVVDAEGRVCGVVSRSDLLKVFLRTDEDLAAEIRTGVVQRLAAVSGGEMHVRVRQGVVTLGGTLNDPRLVPVAIRLIQAVPGVVRIESTLAGPRDASAGIFPGADD